jgi:hypothetical protein
MNTVNPTSDWDRFGSLFEQTIAADPGERRIDRLIVPGDLMHGAISLARAQRVWILTGFVIPAAGLCETDGPPGAIALARGLAALGIPTTILTDPVSLSVIDGAVGIRELALHVPPSHLVAIERPGRGSDGAFHTMNGESFSSKDDPLADLYDAFGCRGVYRMGIGDGGNEIGMGKVRPRVEEFIPHGRQIAAVAGADALIVGGTSNWGAWGLLAGMSLIVGRNLLPTLAQAWEDVSLMSAAGAIDGRTWNVHQTPPVEPSVDGLTRAEYLEPLHRLRAILDEYLARP